MGSSTALDPRILIMGLSDPSFADGGAGAYLARSLRVAFPDVEVMESSAPGPDFVRILRDYDLVILLDCISMCSSVGQVLLVSPYALASLKGAWGEHARALEEAIRDARLVGHLIPAVYVVAVCVPDRDESPQSGSPGLAALYRAVVPRTKQIVRGLIHDARTPPAGPRSFGT